VRLLLDDRGGVRIEAVKEVAAGLMLSFLMSTVALRTVAEPENTDDQQTLAELFC